MIPSLEAIKAINTRRGDAVVVSASGALMEWSSVSGRRELDLDLSDCMHNAPSVGLGIALAQPSRKTLVLDCEILLRTNLGGLVTVGAAAPENLVHFLFEDGDHVSAEGHPLQALDRVDFQAFAEAVGYISTYQFDNLEDLDIGLQEVLEAAGPTFVSLKVVHDQDMHYYPARPMAESFRAVKDALGQGSRHTTPSTGVRYVKEEYAAER